MHLSQLQTDLFFGEDSQTAMDFWNRLKAVADENKQAKLSAKIDALIKQKNPGI